jgi:hypothetical protein
MQRYAIYQERLRFLITIFLFNAEDI